jgi:hypothetical protein
MVDLGGAHIYMASHQQRQQPLEEHGIRNLQFRYHAGGFGLLFDVDNPSGQHPDRQSQPGQGFCASCI